MIPIKDAKDTSLTQNPGTLPNMSGALEGWQQPMTVKKIVKSTVNYELVEAETTIYFSGVLERMTPQQMQMRPEGQRAWVWYNIFCLVNVDLEIDDVVESLGKRYRIKSKNDWSSYGYRSFDAIQDWETA